MSDDTDWLASLKPGDKVAIAMAYWRSGYQLAAIVALLPITKDQP